MLAAMVNNEWFIFPRERQMHSIAAPLAKNKAFVLCNVIEAKFIYKTIVEIKNH